MENSKPSPSLHVAPSGAEGDALAAQGSLEPGPPSRAFEPAHLAGPEEGASEVVVEEPAQEYLFHAAIQLRRTLPSTAPARRYANLSPAECLKLLGQHKISFQRWHQPAKGVATPLKLAGSLEGIQYIFPGGKSPYGVMDCRLVLVLREVSLLAHEFEITRIQLDNMYRPSAHLPGRKNLSQHAHGLAADITRIWFKDGLSASVLDDWQGELGEPACGPEARLREPTEAAIRLRNFVCAIAKTGLFTHMLTPGYDAAHQDHFHFDIKRDAEYQVIR